MLADAGLTVTFLTFVAPAPLAALILIDSSIGAVDGLSVQVASTTMSSRWESTAVLRIVGPGAGVSRKCTATGRAVHDRSGLANGATARYGQSLTPKHVEP